MQQSIRLTGSSNSKLLKESDLAWSLIGIQQTSAESMESVFSAHSVLQMYYRRLSEWVPFTSYRATFLCCFPSGDADIHQPHHHIIPHYTVCLAYLQQLELGRKVMLSCHVTKLCFTASLYSHRSLSRPKCGAANLSSLFLSLLGSRFSFLKLPYL